MTGKEGEKYAVFSGDATDEALTYIAEEDSIYRGTVDLFPYKGGYEQHFTYINTQQKVSRKNRKPYIFHM